MHLKRGRESRILVALVRKRIRDEWAGKWADTFGSPPRRFQHMRKQIAFAEKLREHIGSALAKTGGNPNDPHSRESIKKYVLKGRGLNADFQSAPRNAYAVYVGFSDYEAFADWAQSQEGPLDDLDALLYALDDLETLPRRQPESLKGDEPNLLLPVLYRPAASLVPTEGAPKTSAFSEYVEVVRWERLPAWRQTVELIPYRPKRAFGTAFAIEALLFLIVFMLGRWFLPPDFTEAQRAGVTLTAKKVTDTDAYPVTYEFEYDASSLGLRDGETVKLTCGRYQGDKHEFVFEREKWGTKTSFFKPSFERIELAARGEVVAQTSVYVGSEDWAGWLESNGKNTLTLNYEGDSLRKDGCMHLQEKARVHFDKLMDGSDKFWSLHRLMRHFPARLDSFAYEMRVRNAVETGGVGNCRGFGLTLFGDSPQRGVLLSVTEPGCETYARFFRESEPRHRLWIDTYDTPGVSVPELGFHMDTFRVVRVEFAAPRGRVLLDGEPVYEAEFEVIDDVISGIEIKAPGTPAVDWVRLYDGSGKLVYEEDFGGPAVGGREVDTQ